ncbi:MAG TPA: hypothetical protein VFC78_11495 [Tepidisphaeraceae bacterium]|nr:hypothetical protein [Tepidisphaeraceae bacterium]
MEAMVSEKSLQLVQRIETVAFRRMLDLAVRRAMEQGRDVVTEDDVRACVSAALDEAVQEADATAPPKSKVDSTETIVLPG